MEFLTFSGPWKNSKFPIFSSFNYPMTTLTQYICHEHGMSKSGCGTSGFTHLCSVSTSTDVAFFPTDIWNLRSIHNHFNLQLLFFLNNQFTNVSSKITSNKAYDNYHLRFYYGRCKHFLGIFLHSVEMYQKVWRTLRYIPSVHVVHFPSTFLADPEIIFLSLISAL